MLIVYLDQNQWIELARAANGRPAHADAASALSAVRRARERGEVCFPLSLGHYIETHKQHDSDRRVRLARFMMEISRGVTIAAPHVILRHEIETALLRFFPGRFTPSEFRLLGSGLTHAADQNFDFQVNWPADAAALPLAKRKAIEAVGRALFSWSMLAAALPDGTSAAIGPATDLSPDRRFKDSLHEWRGASTRYTPVELERRIYAITLNDIFTDVKFVLEKHGIGDGEFAQLGERNWCDFLEALPSRRADMHLRRQWARNAALSPKESDLNDWAYIGCAVSYCDTVVTERQMADLLSRGSLMPARVVSKLGDLRDDLRKINTAAS